MTDFFGAFGLPRRPYLDRVALHEAYLSKSEAIHRGAQTGDLSTLNVGYRVLDQVPTRLNHLLELTFGSANTRQPGPQISRLFGEVAAALQNFDHLFTEVPVQTSPILRAMQIANLQQSLPALSRLEDELNRLIECLEQDLPALDRAWQADPEQCHAALEQVTIDLTFAYKWLAQVQERRLRFSELL